MTQIRFLFKMFWVVFVVLTAILAASTGYAFAYPNIAAPAQTPTYSVNIANKPGIGSYLTNGTGKIATTAEHKDY